LKTLGLVRVIEEYVCMCRGKNEKKKIFEHVTRDKHKWDVGVQHGETSSFVSCIIIISFIDHIR
jgi:hypothetical protein